MTYFVIHDDGQKYGPATTEQLRLWLSEGRIGPTTVVEDDSGERKRLVELPGFEDAVVPPPKAAIPAAPPAQAPSGTTYAQAVPARSGAPVAIVVGIVGCAMLFGVAILAAILFPVFAQARLAARKATTLSHAKQAALGVIMYMGDNDDRMPPQFATAEDVHRCSIRYTKSENVYLTLNPAGGEFLGNPKIAGALSVECPEPSLIPMIYESRAWPDGKRATGWLDGHAKMAQDFDPLRDLKDIEGN